MHPKKPYHHGDLKAALLNAVSELVVEKGIETLSLRECARRVGASWSAPAHHFRDKTGLLTAFAIDGFDRLRIHMEKRRDEVDDPALRSVAVGAAYLEFALRNRGHFRVMFRAELLNERDAAYQAACMAAFQVLENAIRDCVPVDSRPSLKERCLLAWSAVHGFATLCLEGAILPDGGSAKAKTMNLLETGRNLLLMLGPSLYSAPNTSNASGPL